MCAPGAAVGNLTASFRGEPETLQRRAYDFDVDYARRQISIEDHR